MGGGLLIFAVGGLLAAAVGASLVAARLQVPALLLFLAVGMAAGPDGAGWVSFSDYGLARDLGIAALALILFDGGLNTRFAEIKPSLGAALRLAGGATVIVAVMTGVAAALLLGIGLLRGLLLGSILASTDSAAVFGLLRTSTLRRRIVRTMEVESGLNDAVVMVLVLGFIGLIEEPTGSVADLAMFAVRQLVVGGICGFVVGKAAGAALRRIRLPRTGLYAVASFACALMAYGSANVLKGSPLLAVYLAGLCFADAPIQGRQTVAAFHDGVAWVGQVGLFVMLGLLASPARLGASFSDGVALALVVILGARPLATFAMTSAREFTLRERIVLSWAELLGATPIVFASFAVASGIPGSTAMFDVVVVAVIVSTLIQGLTFESLARRLRLTRLAPPLPRPLAEFGGAARLGAELVEYTVVGTDGAVGHRVRDLHLPLGITIALIVRGEEAVSPAGSALLKAGDTLHFLVREEVAERIPELLARLASPSDVRPIRRRARAR